MSDTILKALKIAEKYLIKEKSWEGKLDFSVIKDAIAKIERTQCDTKD